MKTTDRLRALADAIERRDLGYSDLAGNTVALLRDASRELERGHDEQRFLTSSVVFAEACAVAVGVFAAQLVGWWAMLLVVPLIALSRKHWNRGGNRGRRRIRSSRSRSGSWSRWFRRSIRSGRRSRR